ncbi:MAG: GNAT family N-acetyltransferase [Bacteroidota bacterium]
MYHLDPDILEVLEKRPLMNLAVLGFFENYKLDKYYKKENSLILLGSSDYIWAYMSVENEADLLDLLRSLSYETLYFANVEDWMLPFLTKEKRIEWRLITERYYIPVDKEVVAPTIVCKPVKQEMSAYIYNNSLYKDFTSEEYIFDRLGKDISAGYWVDNKLVGWALTHDDGSLGFLNIIQEHRGKGIGENLLRQLVLDRIRHNRPAFLNVEPQNSQTKKMLNKIGFEFDRKVSWIKLA